MDYRKFAFRIATDIEAIPLCNPFSDLKRKMLFPPITLVRNRERKRVQIIQSELPKKPSD